MLAQLQSEMNAGSLPEDKRKELAAQMQELAKELAKLAEQKSLIEDELAKLGLDKQLAQAGPEQLRQALQKQGLKPETIDRLLKKVEACQGASARCSGLGQALGGAAGGGGSLSPDVLSGVIDELNSLDAMQQQALLLKASLAEDLEWPGWPRPRHGRAGPMEDRAGRGARGRDWPVDRRSFDHLGPADREQDGEGSEPGGGRSHRGKLVFPGYPGQRRGAADIRGGGSGRTGQCGRGLSENQIPRRYEDAVKAYFNQLEKNGPRP